MLCSRLLRRLLLCAALVSFTPVSSAALTISLEPLGSAPGTDTINLAPGETAMIQIVVRDVPDPGLAAFQIQVLFDPSLIVLEDPNAGSPFNMFQPLGGEAFCGIVRGTGTDCFDPDWFITSTGRMEFLADQGIDNSNGILSMAYGSSGADLPPIGDGVLGLFNITAGDSPATLDFGEVILSDNGEPPQPFPFQQNGLSVIPEPGAASLVTLGLVAVLGRRRRADRRPS